MRQRRGLQEVPPVTRAAEHAGGVEQGHLGQTILRAQLLGKLVPDAGVATVFDEASHVRLLLFAGHHHRRGGTHRYAVHGDRGLGAEELVGDTRPTDHVVAVEPAHTDVIATALTGAVEVGQEDVEAQVVVIEIADHEHAHGAILVAVDDDGRSARGPCGAGVEGMQTDAIVGDDERVAQGTRTAEAVHPRPQEGVSLKHVGVRSLRVAPLIVGRSEGMVEQEEAACGERHDGEQQQCEQDVA